VTKCVLTAAIPGKKYVKCQVEASLYECNLKSHTYTGTGASVPSSSGESIKTDTSTTRDYVVWILVQ